MISLPVGCRDEKPTTPASNKTGSGFTGEVYAQGDAEGLEITEKGVEEETQRHRDTENGRRLAPPT
jgi:hypothetical protein